MIVAGETAMMPSPPRPGEYQLCIGRWGPDKAGEQMTNFWNGKGCRAENRGREVKSRASRREIGWRCIDHDGLVVRGPDDGQESMSEHDQGDMAIPADPLSDLVLTMPLLVLKSSSIRHLIPITMTIFCNVVPGGPKTI